MSWLYRNFGNLVGHCMLWGGLVTILSAPLAITPNTKSTLSAQKPNHIIELAAGPGGIGQNRPDFIQNDSDNLSGKYKTIEDLVNDFNGPSNAVLVVNPNYSSEVGALGVKQNGILTTELLHCFGANDNELGLGSVVHAFDKPDKFNRILDNFRGLILDGTLSWEVWEKIMINLRKPLEIDGRTYPRFVVLKGKIINEMDKTYVNGNRILVNDDSCYFLIDSLGRKIKISYKDGRFTEEGRAELEKLLGRYDYDEWNTAQSVEYFGRSLFRLVGGRRTRIFSGEDLKSVNDYVDGLNRMCDTVNETTGIVPTIPASFVYAPRAELGVNYDPIRLGEESFEELARSHLDRIIHDPFTVKVGEEDVSLVLPLWIRLMYLADLKSRYEPGAFKSERLVSLNVDKETVSKNPDPYFLTANGLRNRLQEAYGDGNLFHDLLVEARTKQWQERIISGYKRGEIGVPGSMVIEMLEGMFKNRGRAVGPVRRIISKAGIEY